MAILRAHFHALFLIAFVTFAAFAGVGCGLDFSPELGSGGEFACGAGNSCPSGFSCAFDNKCYPDGKLPVAPVGVGDAGRDGASEASTTPALTIDDVSVTEGNAGTSSAVFHVKLSARAASDVTVDFATSDGTATAGADYVAASGKLTFPAGTDAQTITVEVNGDTLAEANETYLVQLSSPRGATIAKGSGTGTITDDEGVPTLTISDATVFEGNAGTTPLAFVVTLSVPAATAVTVDYATSDGTATVANNDYVAGTGTLTIPAGATTATITVNANGDTTNESDEAFTLTLTNAANATISDPSAVGTIQNEDGVPNITIEDAQVLEGNASTAQLTFNVRLAAPSSAPVQVGFSTSDGTATAGSDYLTAAGTVIFDPGIVLQTVTVTVNGDLLDEPSETLFVDLANPSGGIIIRAQATGLITSDDALPTLSITDVSVTEGDLGTKTFTFAVNLSAPSGQTVSATFGTTDGTATVGDGDYNAESGTVTFLPGITSASVSVQVNGDALDEPDETFLVSLSSPVNATIAKATGTGSISNDDVAPTISIDDVSVTEGNAGTKTFAFTVTLSAASGRQVTVSFATANGTATTDYTAANGVLTFAPGVVTQTVNVTVNGDATDEPNETFFVNLSNQVGATILDGQGIGTILNDDGPLPTLAITNETVGEGGTATFTVTLSAPSTSVVTAAYATAAGTGTAGVDYTTTSGTVSFPIGQTTQTVTVTTLQDALDEANETFFVNLTSPTNANIADAQGIGTITDDDATPTLSIDNPSVLEGNAGTTTLQFTLTLSAASGQTVSVVFATANGTATIASSDYQSSSGTRTFAPGATTQTINVTVNGDTLNEADETIRVNLSNPVAATIATTQGTGTITNDDAAPTLGITDVTMTEGNSGTKTFAFVVSLSAASGQTVTVSYATADGTATAGSDYTAVGATLLTFTAGQTTKTVNVIVTGDTAVEPNETFSVNLTGATVATIADGQGLGTITGDDNPLPILTINNVTVTEGNAGTPLATFTVTLSAASTSTVTVQYATADGTATQPADYTTTSATLSFTAGQTSKTFTVPVKGEALFELDETFVVNLTNPVNAVIGAAQGQATIVNDDTAPTLSIGNKSLAEGNAGTANMAFTVTLSAATGATATVNYATADLTGTAGADYTATSGTLTFLPGSPLTQTVNVPVVGDTTDENDETFNLTLSNSVNATLTTATGVGTITNDDTPPAITINNVTAPEGDGGGAKSFVFTVTLSAASGKTVSVQYATANGTASSTSDYTAIALSTLTFNPAVLTQTITVSVGRDNSNESDETFFVNLSNPTNATLVAGTKGTGTIQDDD